MAHANISLQQTVKQLLLIRTLGLAESLTPDGVPEATQYFIETQTQAWHPCGYMVTQ